MEELIKRYETISGRIFNLYMKEYDEYVFEDKEGYRYFLKKDEIVEAINTYEETSKQKPIFEFSLTEDFSFVSNWVRESDFDLLKEEVVVLRANYQKFINENFPNFKGIHTRYSELDSDDFGTFALPNPVLKWLISFNPTHEEGSTESIEGLEK